MATATEYASPPPFSRSSSLSVNRSPDTASLIYPERAIRPLPRSRLKAKLSPEQASNITYPPEPSPASPTLQFSEQESAHSGTQDGRMTNGGNPHGQYLHHRPHDHQDGRPHPHCTCGHEADSGDDEVEFDHPDYRYATPTANGTGDKTLDSVQRRLMEAARIPSHKPPPPASAASSADGYESFENTSNKKKRKIPLSTASNMHQSQLSAEMASMGINGHTDGMDDDGSGAIAVQQPYSPPAGNGVGSGTGISGAGRGRYGRQNGRSDHGIRRPLASSSVNSVNGYNARLPVRGGSDVRNGADTGIENTGGIISQAIKTAAEQGPLTPQKGQDNASLLHSAAANASATGGNKSQFTFAVESESANKLIDQQAAAVAAQAAYGTPTPNNRGVNGQAMPSAGARGMNAQGTSSHRGSAQQNGTANRAPPAAPPNNQQQPLPAAPAPKPKPRRRPSKEYALAARQRRLQQEYTNYHHRPTKDNIWICEFCEYEDIFGVPPVAMIRQYEIRDRQERKRQAEKRRLLEKAKAKNKRNKKGGKKNNAHANNAATAAAAGGQAYDPNLDLNLPPPGDEEYYDDEYGDEYDPVGPDDEYANEYYPPPPAPVGSMHGVHGPGGGGGKYGAG